MTLMANLYSNENFPLDLVLLLRQQGHNIVTSYESGQANQGITDEDVLTFATKSDRSVITLNRDDFLKLHRLGINHSGIIICKDDRDYSAQAETLNNFLQAQTDLINRLIRIQKQNQPKSKSQIFIVREYQ
jgi:predicted nuclease of predicted toxin-antitoxin system